MKKFLLIIAFAGVAFQPAFAQSGRINGSYVGCLTSGLLDEFVRAATNDDTRQMNALLSQGCYPINGREFSIISRGFLTSQVRIYVDGGSVELWTITSATR